MLKRNCFTLIFIFQAPQQQSTIFVLIHKITGQLLAISQFYRSVVEWNRTTATEAVNSTSLPNLIKPKTAGK